MHQGGGGGSPTWQAWPDSLASMRKCRASSSSRLNSREASGVAPRKKARRSGMKYSTCVGSELDLAIWVMQTSGGVGGCKIGGGGGHCTAGGESIPLLLKTYATMVVLVTLTLNLKSRPIIPMAVMVTGAASINREDREGG